MREETQTLSKRPFSPNPVSIATIRTACRRNSPPIQMQESPKKFTKKPRRFVLGRGFPVVPSDMGRPRHRGRTDARELLGLLASDNGEPISGMEPPATRSSHSGSERRVPLLQVPNRSFHPRPVLTSRPYSRSTVRDRAGSALVLVPALSVQPPVADRSVTSSIS
jgi:hypothetical protein